MQNAPHNPGLSDKAWKNFNKLMARLNLKYGSKLQKVNDPKGAA